MPKPPSPERRGLAPLEEELRRLAAVDPRRLEDVDDLRERTFSLNSSASLRIRFSNCVPGSRVSSDPPDLVRARSAELTFST